MNSRYWKTIIMITMSVTGIIDSAWADHFWDQHAQGWHWYEDPSGLHQTQPVSISDPIKTMETWHQKITRALDQAILNPTPANMRAYITLQNEVSGQANRFALAWQAALLNDPALDYSLSHPTNSMGKAVYLTEQKQQEDQAIAQLAQHSGLFFFYRSSCPYCQRFAPIVKDFSERYGIAIVPITTDGIALPAFPHSHKDQGQAAQLKVTQEPALLTVNPYSRQIIPVSYGLMSEDELRTRILAIAHQLSSTPPKP